MKLNVVIHVRHLQLKSYKNVQIRTVEINMHVWGGGGGGRGGREGGGVHLCMYGGCSCGCE